MCFNARFLLKVALRRAVKNNVGGDIELWGNALKNYDELFMVSGFDHPEIIIYTNDKPYQPVLSTWGLIPQWANDTKSIWNKTLNARGESIFEKPSFRESAKTKRCLIPVEGFYEHHYYKGKPYPFYICHKKNNPLTFAGLWSEWINPNTGEIINSCSIVTTKANHLMTKIHNNPKLPESRMPVILQEELENEWLKPLSQKELQELLRPYPDSELMAYTVRKLKGQNSPGNVPESNEKYEYPELEFGSNQLSLFD